jgi:hypothetical protein
MEQKNVSGVTKDNNVARIALIGFPTVRACVQDFFAAFKEKHNVDNPSVYRQRKRQRTSASPWQKPTVIFAEVLEDNKDLIGFSIWR